MSKKRKLNEGDEFLQKQIRGCKFKFGVILYRNGCPSKSDHGYCAAWVTLKPLDYYKESTKEIQWAFECNGKRRISKRWEIHELIQKTDKMYNLFPIKHIEDKSVVIKVKIFPTGTDKAIIKDLLASKPSKHVHLQVIDNVKLPTDQDQKAKYSYNN